MRKVRGALIGLVCLLTCTLPVQADEVTGAVKSGLSSAAVFAGESKNEFQTFEFRTRYISPERHDRWSLPDRLLQMPF